MWSDIKNNGQTIYTTKTKVEQDSESKLTIENKQAGLPQATAAALLEIEF